MKKFGTNVIRWLVRLFWWIARARLALFCAAVIALGLAAPLLYSQSEPSIRISGLLLQLLGIGAAATGIRDTRRMFGKPSFLQSVRNWLQSIPGITPRVISASGSATASASATAKVEVWRGAGNDPTIDSRLSAAEANLLELRDRINSIESAFDAHVRTAREGLRQEKAERQEGNRQLHLKIEAASADGLHLAAVGVAWLAFGVSMSTLSNELLAIVR